jgi:CDGSH-type Zn-finger protein
MKDSKAVVAGKAPMPVEVVAGKAYFWCTCGRSKNQPFCDGAHLGTGRVAYDLQLEQATTVMLCGCGHSRRYPLCDGRHKAAVARPWWRWWR